MSGKDKWVRRFSVDETARHKNGFTIYKITSVLFPIESPEAVTVVSVWKRFSDVRRLHKNMLALHAGLHLRGSCPLPKFSYFRRFQREVIEERAKAIKRVLEFVAEHRLLFTSAEFVAFLQSGYPAPAPARSGGVIESIRAALQLPAERLAPLEYPSDDSATDPSHPPQPDRDETDLAAIPQIPIYEAADVEIRPASHAASFESLNSLDSLNDDLYDALNKLTVDNKKSAVKKKTTLPDLINFDAPSSSRFEDYHTMPRQSDASSMNSTNCSSRSNSRMSLYSKKSVPSLSNADSKTRTEDSYVFEAGYMLNLAARCEDMRDYQRAFECYKAGIEKMLIGVQTDSDPQRRALIKEKTNKYLSYAEEIYKNHLCDADDSPLPEPPPALEQGPVPLAMLRRPYDELAQYRVLAVLGDSLMLVLHEAAQACLAMKPLPEPPPALEQGPVPLAMLRRPYDELAQYRVLAVLGDSLMLVLHEAAQACLAMKVIQKIPNNLTEFDEYFLQRSNETRQPVLPTSIPYMVPLHAYVETDNLIFLILSYAPGQKLLDYIGNYVKSAPITPARELNLENVFSEPMKKDDNLRNEDDIKFADDAEESENNNGGDEVEALVKNSQKLLQNVDRALLAAREGAGGGQAPAEGDRRGRQSPTHLRAGGRGARRALPASALRTWAAQILTAIESLHNAGVICRDLNPSNILLGDGGRVVLTYCVGYPRDVALARLARRAARARPELAAAPELYRRVCADDDADDRLADYWSFGAIMYELLCGVPLSHYHKSVFTSHTLLELPAELSVEEESLLTQLLTYEPAARLGRGGVAEIQQHPYFARVDWRSLRHAGTAPG